MKGKNDNEQKKNRNMTENKRQEQNFRNNEPQHDRK